MMFEMSINDNDYFIISVFSTKNEKIRFKEITKYNYV